MSIQRYAMRCVGVASMLLILASAGCGDDPVGSGGGGETGLRGEAARLIRDEIDKRTASNADGVASVAKQSTTTGRLADFTVQYKKLEWSLHDEELSEADKANGIEYIGEVRVKETARRFHNGQKWSEWSDYSGDLFRVEKKGGQWKIEPYRDGIFGSSPIGEKPASIPG